MAGFKIVTDLDEDTAFKIARRAARDLDFSVKTVETMVFRTSKGNLALSIFAGAFVAYCDFVISVEENRNSTTIFLERNSPWWTGVIGVNRVKNRAKELAEAIADAIEDARGRVLKEKEI